MIAKPTPLYGARAALRETFARLLPHRIGPEPSTFSRAENVGKRAIEEETAGRTGNG